MILQKLSASGNDFLIFHTFVKSNYANLAQKVCDRRYGFGADGLIVLVPHSEYDYEWLFYNSDGSLANMCGNGARATAIYAKINNLAQDRQKFLTGAGVISAQVFDNNVAEVTLTKPHTLTLDANGYTKIDTGVPHLVKQVDTIDNFNIPNAKELRYTHDANVNEFCIAGDEIFVRTYERGVEDETLACGTGMAACVWSIIEKSNLESAQFKVRPKSNELIEISYINKELKLKGVVSIIGSCMAS